MSLQLLLSFRCSISDNVLISWVLVDRWGRRFILLSGAVVVRKSHVRVVVQKFDHMHSQMALSLGLTGWWMYIDVPETPRAVVICVIIFNAAFGYSWGPIPWLYPPEVRVTW